MHTTTPYPGTTYVIPCGAAKVVEPAPARYLYIGRMFRHTLTAVERLVALDEAEGNGPARVLILSARHGLVDLDRVLAPYDMRMRDAGAVTAEALTAQATALGIVDRVYAFVPRAYLARLDAALQPLGVAVQDVYEGCRGIGDQRAVNARVGIRTT